MPLALYTVTVVQHEDSFLMVGGRMLEVNKTTTIYKYDVANDARIEIPERLGTGR